MRRVKQRPRKLLWHTFTPILGRYPENDRPQKTTAVFHNIFFVPNRMTSLIVSLPLRNIAFVADFNEELITRNKNQKRNNEV